MKPDLRKLLGHSSLAAEPGAAGKRDKVFQSAAVRRIIQRARDVIKRRDLTIPFRIPTYGGPWEREPVDPNTVAEYLDGVISADRAAEIEEL